MLISTSFKISLVFRCRNIFIGTVQVRKHNFTVNFNNYVLVDELNPYDAALTMVNSEK